MASKQVSLLERAVIDGDERGARPDGARRRADPDGHLRSATPASPSTPLTVALEAPLGGGAFVFMLAGGALSWAGVAAGSLLR